MRRGCISLGEVKCDICRRTIPYPERYLVVDEEDGVEVESVHPEESILMHVNARLIDFDNPENNEFIVTNQFKVSGISCSSHTENW